MHLLAWAAVLGLLGLGLGTMPFPGALSRFYGVPLQEAAGHAWVRAAGARDVALGAILAPLLVHHADRAAGLVLVITGLLAVFDFVNASMRGAPWSARLFHGLGAAGLMLVGALLVHRG